MNSFRVFVLTTAVALLHCPADAGYLLVSNPNLNNVLRFDAASGQFVDQFVPGTNSQPGLGGLVSPNGIAFGPDGNVYVASTGTGQILKYDWQSGSFLGVFASRNDLLPSGITFRSDGNLYVNNASDGTVLRFDGMTGDFIDTFAAAGVGSFGFNSNGDLTGDFANAYVRDGLSRFTFGPDGTLFATPLPFSSPYPVNEYDPTTGKLLETFAIVNEADPDVIRFGPDGNLYVSVYNGAGRIARFDGVTGEYIDDFVTAGVPHSDAWLPGPSYFVFSPDSYAVPEPPSFLLDFIGILGISLMASRVRQCSRPSGESV